MLCIHSTILLITGAAFDAINMSLIITIDIKHQSAPIDPELNW